ncbi:MAG TPA: PIG-L family deacetylase [Tepidisphaeraceae bacterium]|nr:PIG-L family deacetylase [Tepidisphaeraceae bacterium]
MKHTSKSHDLRPLLAVGAHPDDIEFACGAIIARETDAGRPVHFLVCSRGEAASHGTPQKRRREATRAAAILGATLQWIELDGDAKLEMRASHAINIARIIRKIRPGIVLAPTLVENQHPDHWRLGRIVRDAARLARFAGLKELRSLTPHSIDQLLYYASSADSEPRDRIGLLIDVSAGGAVEKWVAAMAAHVSQHVTRNYTQLHLARAKAAGLRAGVMYAIPLFCEDPIVVDSLSPISRGARNF